MNPDAGKTTVGKLITKLVLADCGEVLLEGRDFLKLEGKALRKARKDIQMIFQDPYGSLNPTMDIMSILAEPMLLHKTATRNEVPKRVTELLNKVGLNAADRFKYPHEFSGGQRQRIVVARALASEPKLIICDEPVSALDVSIQAQILNLLQDLQKELGVSYLFIAHGMAVVKHVSDRVGVMYLGSILEMAPASTIFERCLHPYTQALISAAPIPDPELERERIILDGEMPDSLSPIPGCKFASRCIYANEECRQSCPALIEIEPKHFVACHQVKPRV